MVGLIVLGEVFFKNFYFVCDFILFVDELVFGDEIGSVWVCVFLCEFY